VAVRSVPPGTITSSLSGTRFMSVLRTSMTEGRR
jgi:hypothetical protein